MKQEIACPGPMGNVTLRAESLPFASIPGQSKLFVQYQSDPLSLKRYYPNVIESHTQIADRIPEVLANHKADRKLLCDALEETNNKFGATQQTLDNIAMLRDDDTVAVVTGQQAGLFSGPLYTIYKALSAVRMAECPRGRGFKAVPVFWVATEDHDFEEVSNTFVIGKKGSVVELKNEPKRCYQNLPVGYIKLDDSITETIDELFRELAPTEFTDELKALISESWTPGAYFGDGFGILLTKLLGKYGVIVLCPLNNALKQLAAPMYVEAIKKSAEIVTALQERSAKLVEDGYTAQVLIGDDYFPLFWQARDDTRNALKKSKEGTFKTKDGTREFTLHELAEIAAHEPYRFSPSVVLRSVVQDYILPTVCYFGGGAEISYFAQSGEVYRILGRPVTPIIHRQSFSFIETKHAKTLSRYDLEFADLFAGIEALLPGIVEKHLNQDAATLFADVEERINIELHRLDEGLSAIDTSLVENLAKRRRKILYHIAALRNKFHHVQLRKDETIQRRIETMFTALMPNGALQERSLNIGYFIDRYGVNFVDWIYKAIDLDDKGHRLIYL
ncbi:MAG TPA: bacillithiol biosynthesis cysteine-adding enzyme BshC [Pyrinomonadaceae bacterium]|nr:bacillithiol biosynthesis cysteine-adding enzyme BshC [Pyrinomonadaceae bacterium]